jgi:hypothetical protein
MACWYRSATRLTTVPQRFTNTRPPSEKKQCQHKQKAAIAQVLAPSSLAFVNSSGVCSTTYR